MCPANAPRRDSDRSYGAHDVRLALDRLPKLQALVEGPDGPAILLELQTLVRRVSPRAPRYERNLFSRVRVHPDAPPEVAVVRDLSRSGVRLELTAAAHLDVMQARTVMIELRLPGSPFVNCPATLVRVVEHHPNGVELAFSFGDAVQRDPAFESLLAQLAASPHGVR